MFYCQVLKKLSKPGQKCHKVVSKIKRKSYTRSYKDEETGKMVKEVIATGFEIVEELNATEEGVAYWNKAHPEGPQVVK